MRLQLKAKISLMIIIFLLVLLGGNTVQAAEEPGFTISQYDTRMLLEPDGSAEVVETLSYQISQGQSSFSFAIDYAGAGNVLLENIGVAAGSGNPAEAVFVEVPQTETATNQNAPMAYQLRDNGRKLSINLQVLTDDQSSRMVRISYRLSQAAVRQKDVALIKRDFFSIGGPVEINRPSLTIKLPGAAAALQTWSLAVSATDFTKSQPQPDLLLFQADQLAAGQTMTLFCLLPVNLFEKATAAAQPLSRSELIGLARQAESERKRQSDLFKVANSLVFILLAFALLVGFIIFWFFDKESGASFRNRFSHEIPADIPPALLAILMRKQNPGRLILATLMDLVRRGVLQLHGCVFSQPERTEARPEGLASYEIFLLEWFFERMATGKTLSTADIRRLARDPETSGEFHIYFNTFSRLLRDEFAQAGLVDKSRGLRGRNLCLLAALLYLAMAIASVLCLQNASGLLLLLPTALLAVYSGYIRRLTVAGRELYARGQAVRRSMIQDAREASPDPGFFQRALPLAIGLGIDHALLQKMLRFASSSPDIDISLADYGFPAAPGRFSEQIMVLAADLKVMVSMLSASLLIAAGTYA